MREFTRLIEKVKLPTAASSGKRFAIANNPLRYSIANRFGIFFKPQTGLTKNRSKLGGIRPSSSNQ